jgi:hypothetical protein
MLIVFLALLNVGGCVDPPIVGGVASWKYPPLPWTQRVWGARKILGYKQGNVPRGTLSSYSFTLGDV